MPSLARFCSNPRKADAQLEREKGSSDRSSRSSSRRGRRVPHQHPLERPRQQELFRASPVALTETMARGMVSLLTGMGGNLVGKKQEQAQEGEGGQVHGQTRHLPRDESINRAERRPISEGPAQTAGWETFSTRACSRASTPRRTSPATFHICRHRWWTGPATTASLLPLHPLRPLLPSPSLLPPLRHPRINILLLSQLVLLRLLPHGRHDQRRLHMHQRRQIYPSSEGDLSGRPSHRRRRPPRCRALSTVAVMALARRC